MYVRWLPFFLKWSSVFLSMTVLPSTRKFPRLRFAIPATMSNPASTYLSPQPTASSLKVPKPGGGASASELSARRFDYIHADPEEITMTLSSRSNFQFECGVVQASNPEQPSVFMKSLFRFSWPSCFLPVRSSSVIIIFLFVWWS